MTTVTPTILLVEDNDDDVFAMQRALRKAQITLPVQVVTNGQKAVDYLSGAGDYSDRNYYPFPSLVFLDLKLPYIHGFEILGWIREQPGIRDLAVVVLTSSGEESDRNRADTLGVYSYIVKPPEPQQLRRLLEALPQVASISTTPV
jgi:CheY-like chemotaxis protein